MNITTHEPQIRQLIGDATGAIWNAAELAAAYQHALDTVTAHNPKATAATLPVAGGQIATPTNASDTIEVFDGATTPITVNVLHSTALEVAPDRTPAPAPAMATVVYYTQWLPGDSYSVRHIAPINLIAASVLLGGKSAQIMIAANCHSCQSINELIDDIKATTPTSESSNSNSNGSNSSNSNSNSAGGASNETSNSNGSNSSSSTSTATDWNARWANWARATESRAANLDALTKAAQQMQLLAERYNQRALEMMHHHHHPTPHHEGPEPNV